jgi:DNA modification methylase
MIEPYYQDDAVTLYCGNARELVPQLDDVDHVITDPPYDVHTHQSARSGYRKGVVLRLAIDFAPLDIGRVAPMLLRVSRRWVVCFCSLEMLGTYRDVAGDAWVRAGFWRRTDGAPQFTGDRPGQPGEALAICHRAGRKRWNGGGRHGYYEFGVERRDGRLHPTQKPEALMLAILSDFTDPGDVVLDPFAGSGTTLVACKRLGRRAIGIEMDRRYCDAIVSRLRQAALFAEVADDATQGSLLTEDVTS